MQIHYPDPSFSFNVATPGQRDRIPHQIGRYPNSTWLLMGTMIVGVYLSIAGSGLLAFIGSGDIFVLVASTLVIFIPVSNLVLDKLGLTGIFDGIDLPDFGDD